MPSSGFMSVPSAVTWTDAIILLSLLLVFADLFYLYLCWLTRYFENISKGMDTLIQDVSGEISVLRELLPIERKMNLVKHTIDRQKSDMLLAKPERLEDLINEFLEIARYSLSTITLQCSEINLFGYLDFRCAAKYFLSPEQTKRFLFKSLVGRRD